MDPVMGIDKILFLILSIGGFFLFYFKISIPLLLGILSLFIQFLVSNFNPSTFRLSTFIYSTALTLSFISIYTLVYDRHVFSIQYFINLMKYLIIAFFFTCIIQQALILSGFRNIPWINLYYLGRGFGCSSLSFEPSTFARFLFVYYFAYIKCFEYKQGFKISIKEVFSVEHRMITLMFLWMMCTMGSGTAFVCLALLSLNFISKNNWYYIIPATFAIFFLILPNLNLKESNRAVNIMTAITTFDQQQVENADGSGASRISPLLNSFTVDFTQKETWFGHGTDYAKKNNLFIKQESTLFDDYGLIWYITILAFSLYSAYGYSFYTTILMFSGVAGGGFSNINYAWCLMIIISCIRYFHLNNKSDQN